MTINLQLVHLAVQHVESVQCQIASLVSIILTNNHHPREGMTPIGIKFEGGSSVAVIFIKSGVHKKMKEEVDELVPENFHFLVSWGPPIGRLQDTKMALTEALHEENYWGRRSQIRRGH